MSTSRFASVDDYLASLDPVKAKTVSAIIDTILTNIPETSTKLAWNVPQFQYKGKYVGGASAAKNHVSFNPWSEAVLSDFRPRLEADGYTVLQSLFQVPVDWDVDQPLITDMVRARIAELGLD